MLAKADIRRLFALLDRELASQEEIAELYLVGGAVMCLVFDARASTKDVDGYFQPTRLVREAASRVAAEAGLARDWLNDAVKGYLSDAGSFAPYLELSHLRVFCADARYMLAMKCLAFRIGEEFQDEDDIRYLLRHLDLRRYDDALAVIEAYYPRERIPQKTLYALAEILSED